MSDHHADDSTTHGPYAAHARAYHAAGWSPLPLPPGAKKHPPEGWTGSKGAWPSGADVHAWTEDHPGGNIALRLPPHVLGIDVDSYADKPGGAVLAELEQRHGPLPATWVSSARDGVSGIRYYQIPPGLRWPGILGPGIEIIRHGHRYAVAPPSTHPDTHTTYRWRTPEGAVVIGDYAPVVDDLPHLPDTWVQALTGGQTAADLDRADLTDADAAAWLRLTGEHECPALTRITDRAITGMAATGSRHEHALAETNRIIWAAGCGHQGAPAALARLQAAFMAATAGDRTEGEARAEWVRMIAGAVQLAAAVHPTPERADPCTDPFAHLIDDGSNPPAATPGSSGSNSPTPSPDSPAADTPASTPAAGDTPGSTTADPALLELFTQAHQDNLLTLIADLKRKRDAQRWLEENDETDTVADRVRRRLLDDKVAQAYREATEPPAPPFDIDTLGAVLARPDDPPARAEGLIPWAANTLVVAQRKTGKTTFMLNIARSLLTGEPLLGEFDVVPLQDDQTVALLNYEVSAKQVALWAADVGIDPDRLVLVNLRGRRNPLSNAGERTELARLLQERHVTTMLVDPFGRAYNGESQNDNAEVQKFLLELEMFTREEVGAVDLVLAAHAGWNGERTRGASALEDWPDTIITLSLQESEDGSARRFMKALGRDVDVDEDELVMDPLTRRQTRAGTGPRGGSVRQRPARDSALAALATRLVNAADGPLRRSELREAMLASGEVGKVSERSLGAALRLASQGDFIVVHEGVGPRRGHVIHRRDRDCSHCSRPLPEQSTTTAPAPHVVGAERCSRQSDAKNVAGSSHEAPSDTPRRIRPLAGGTAYVDLDTGEVIDQ